LTSNVSPLKSILLWTFLPPSPWLLLSKTDWYGWELNIYYSFVRGTITIEVQPGFWLIVLTHWSVNSFCLPVVSGPRSTVPPCREAVVFSNCSVRTCECSPVQGNTQDRKPTVSLDPSSVLKNLS
jgi:hypothetical protein